MKYKIVLNWWPSLWASDFFPIWGQEGQNKPESWYRTLWTSGSDQNLEKTHKNKDLATSPEVRAVVETLFFLAVFYFLFSLLFGVFLLVWINHDKLELYNLGGSETTDQSVEVPDTCFCEETCYSCYRIAYIQNELWWVWVSSFNVYPKSFQFTAHNSPFCILLRHCTVWYCRTARGPWKSWNHIDIY
jgi:hypothetical protein